jgi:hypothetical protein
MASKTIKVAVIPVDGDIEITEWERPEYQKMKTTVGGWLEAIYPASNVTMWCNEEGKIEGLPVNRNATALWYFLQPEAAGRDTLSGTVIVTGGADSEGEAKSIDPMIEAMIGKFYAPS